MPQCQFLFSAVFRFRKVTQEIFSELDDSKTEVPIFSVPKELTWREPIWGHRVATRGLGAASPGPAPRVRVGPLAASDSASSPIYSTYRESPRHPSHIPRKVPSRSPSPNPSRGVLELFLAPCRREKSLPEAFFITMP